eukprot:scaffold625_cov324-Pavlova_lutheri.AAC.7
MASLEGGVSSKRKRGKDKERKRKAEKRNKGVQGGREGSKKRRKGMQLDGTTPNADKASNLSSKNNPTDLFEKMKARLSGGRFRWLNEQLYTTTGVQAFAQLTAEPELFQQYHEGFREQTRGWPQQPIDVVARWLNNKKKDLVVADFGCGDAKLSDCVKQKVHSLDLVATKPGVVACNMAATPLASSSIDVAVFCLALMGTDYGKFLEEANRVLRTPGYLWIAEVRSRFGEGFEEQFLENLSKMGFILQSKNMSNKMFAVYILEKKRQLLLPKRRDWPAFKPCIYKRR